MNQRKSDYRWGQGRSGRSWVILAAACALFLFWLTGQFQGMPSTGPLSPISSSSAAHEWGRTELVGKPAPELALVDQHGQPFRLSDQKGRVVVLYFGYTLCPDTCPLTMHHFAQTKEALGDDAAGVRFALVTVNPERDTPGRLAEYMALFGDDFLGLRGSEANLKQAYYDYGIFAVAADDPSFPDGYRMRHSWAAYVVDTRGYIRLARVLDASPQGLAAVLRQMLREDAPARVPPQDLR